MDKRTFMKKFAIWTAVVVAVVMLIIGLCFGKVLEETLFGEIMKWVVMTVVIIGIFEVFAYTQAAGDATLSISPTTINLTAAGVADNSVTVTSNTSWSIT